MIKRKNKEILGIILIAVGVLFLLANYGILWFKWGAIWPILIILCGGFLLRIFAGSNRPELLFGGLICLFLGLFFMVFTTGILPWENLSTLWPTFPMIGGISLLALSGVRKESSGSVVVGVAAIIFSITSYAYAGGMIESRVTVGFVRLWPLVLIGSGALIFLRARRGSPQGELLSVQSERETSMHRSRDAESE